MILACGFWIRALETSMRACINIFMKKLLEKKCPGCKETKPRSEYYIHTNKSGGESISGKCRECVMLDNNRRRFTPGGILTAAKSRAKQSGMECTITIDDIVIPERCPVFGTEWEMSKDKHDYNPSLDRIDSSKGYIPGNVLVVSWKANRIKRAATIEDLQAIVECYTSIGPREQLDLF